MNKAHYIIFHPNKHRQSINVKATALVNNKIEENWQGNIWVDKIGDNNEDPYVFNNPWLYSYCHASQLRRQKRKDSFLQIGSKIIFGYVNEQNLIIDTVFLVGNNPEWERSYSSFMKENKMVKELNLQMPQKYRGHFKKMKSDLWMRHFRFPFCKIHQCVTHTYEAELWDMGKADFSFLPIDRNNQRVTISLNELDKTLKNTIVKNIIGKYPVLLSDNEINEVIHIIELHTSTKVLKDILNKAKVVSKIGICNP